MATPMSPSDTITTGQIAKWFDNLSAALRKSGLPSQPTQKVLEGQGDELAANFVADVRKRVDAISEMIVRHVKVDRTRTPQAMLDATGRKQHTTTDVVENMPRGEGDETDVFFFPVRRYISDPDLEKEFDLHGLKPADVYSQAQVNIDDPSFADDHPNGTHWKDADGNWCYAAFDRWYDDRRRVNVNRDGDDWNDRWWFAGVRK